MILKRIITAYCTIGILLYVSFTVILMKNPDFLLMHSMSLGTFLVFAIAVTVSYKKRKRFFVGWNLFFTVFVCLVIEAVLFQMASWFIDEDFFVFSKIDAMEYYLGSLKMSNMGIVDSFRYLYQKFSFDDWGAFLWVTSVFRIVPSVLFLNFLCCIMGAFSALMMFNIGRSLMPKRYAYMAALTFSIASFAACHCVGVRKEHVTSFLILAAFYFFYLYLRKRNRKSLVFSLLFILSVLLFRVPVALFLFFSLGLTLILIYSKGPVVIILGALLSIVICSSSLFTLTFESYLSGGDTEAIIERKIEMASGGGIVNQAADPLAALAGPFPSIMMKITKGTCFYASGLLFRVLLAAPFFVGVYYAFRHKYKKLYPLIFFFLANALGVAISVKGLEYRLSHPHMAMMYLVAFWMLAKYDYHRMKRQLPAIAVYGWFILVTMVCLVWNLR